MADMACLYAMNWRAYPGLLYGLAGMVWYIIWTGGHAGYMVRPSGHGISYGLVRMAWYMVWPGGYCMVYGMAWQASHGLMYGLPGMALCMPWHMVWPSGLGILYGMV